MPLFSQPHRRFPAQPWQFCTRCSQQLASMKLLDTERRAPTLEEHHGTAVLASSSSLHSRSSFWASPRHANGHVQGCLHLCRPNALAILPSKGRPPPSSPAPARIVRPRGARAVQLERQKPALNESHTKGKEIAICKRYRNSAAVQLLGKIPPPTASAASVSTPCPLPLARTAAEKPGILLWPTRRHRQIQRRLALSAGPRVAADLQWSAHSASWAARLQH